MDFSESIHKTLLVIVELGIVLGSSGMVLPTNTVHSAFLLGLVLICISLLYLALNADFVAAAQVPVYVGAVNVLIAFAVMPINKSQDKNFFSSRAAGDNITLSICISLFSLLIVMIMSTSWYNICLIKCSSEIIEQPSAKSFQRIGFQLLTDFSIPFELLSILLLAALVGAIDIVRPDRTIGIPDDGALQPEEDSSLF
uniref:NAD(P)H-quinone oxidoreductase subunit 6, chloroplastic n=1 Tax=Mankyua chejuensis TaxID=996148 RepID=H8Y665_9MONI|nr:NADH-plastoquinone oxidoreductase subunit 6 [Mankyua chejuensis]ADZ48033.1 NADH-plastoquinone oxidoreductase subunit 6 [Mankyua chejuensis]AJJ48664.1 NADH dehydrogenase subunit 6 [Mankyua chejuensis]